MVFCIETFPKIFDNVIFVEFKNDTDLIEKLHADKESFDLVVYPSMYCSLSIERKGTVRRERRKASGIGKYNIVSLINYKVSFESESFSEDYYAEGLNDTTINVYESRLKGTKRYIPSLINLDCKKNVSFSISEYFDVTCAASAGFSIA